MLSYTKRPAHRKVRLVGKHEYYLYDGTTYLGRFTFDDATGKGKAYDRNRNLIGTFSGYTASAAAVSNMAGRRR